MDILGAAGFESQLRVHDACFDKCVTGLTEAKLDRQEQTCIKNCYKSWVLTNRASISIIDAQFDAQRRAQINAA